MSKNVPAFFAVVKFCSTNRLVQCFCLIKISLLIDPTTKVVSDLFVKSFYTHACISLRKDLGFIYKGANPFWVCSRLDPIHTGPVCTQLIWIRSKVV